MPTNEVTYLVLAGGKGERLRPLTDNRPQPTHQPPLVSRMARIGGATIENSVIAPGVTVEDGAFISHSVLLDGSIVHRNASISGIVLEPLATIPEGGRQQAVYQ